MILTRKLLLSIIIFVLIYFNGETGGKRINFFQPSEDFITPHIKWLKPYYKEKPKVLFIIPRTGMREIVEISQRIDIEYKVFVTHEPNKIARKESIYDWVKGASEEERLEYFDELLEENYNVILIGDINWDILPVEYKYKILKKVKDGTGLVGIINKRDEILNKIIEKGKFEITEEEIKKYFSNFPFKFVSEQYNSINDFLKNTVEFSKFGAGKICLFKYSSGSKLWMGSFHPFVPGPLSEDLFNINLIEYDYQLLFVINCILYASNKKNSFLYNYQMNYLFDLPQISKILYIFENEEKFSKVIEDFFILNENGERVYNKKIEIPLNPHKNILNFEIPNLPIGKYTANLIIEKEGKIIDFSSCIFEIRGGSFIKEINLSKKSYKKNEKIEGKIIIENPNKNFKIILYLKDTYRRIIDKKTFKVDNNEIRFSFDLNFSITIVQSIEAELRNSREEILSTCSKKFIISDIYPPEDEFRIILWSEMPKNGTFFTPHILNYWKESGIDTIYLGFNKFIFLSNMWFIPYLYRFADEKTDWYGKPSRDIKDLIRKPCLTDPDYLKRLKEILINRVNEIKDYPIKEISFGDECLFVSGEYDLCFSKTCIEDFKRFLKDKYKTIEKLNEEYEANYNSFEEVKPLDIEKAKKENKISMWVDHRLHMDEIWAGIFKYSGDICKEILNEIKTGYEGSDSSVNTWYSNDYWKLSKAMNMNNIYFKEFQACAWRSFFEKNKLLGLGWMGGYGSPYDKKSNYDTYCAPWKYLFKGANSLWIWHANPREGSITTPDFSFYDFFYDVINSIKEIKSGIGKMLINCEKMTNVGIYYSPSSIHTNTFLNLPIPPDKNLNSITILLIDLGFQPRVYSYEEVKNGILNKNKPKFLFMHNIQALSFEEINEIKKYVEEGGIIIADIFPGIRNEHGKLYKEGMLNEVFGIEITDGKEIKKFEKVNIGNINFSILLCDSSVKVKNGEFMQKIDNVPIIIKNKFGYGYGILLNFLVEEYQDVREKDFFENPYFLIFKKLLKEINISPEIIIENNIPYIETNIFISGKAKLFTFYQDIPKNKKNQDISKIDRKSSSIKIKFKEKGHIYDVRKGIYYGEKNEIELNITPLEPLIIALLPYKIERIKISLSKSILKQGEKFEYKVDTIGKEDINLNNNHIINVRFFDPDGKEVFYYSENINVNDRKTVKTALNEKKGKWTIIATDVISKKQDKINFVIK